MGVRLAPIGEWTSWIERVPFSAFWGSKKAHTPLLPAGHATTSLGPMMERLLSGKGLVMMT